MPGKTKSSSAVAISGDDGSYEERVVPPAEDNDYDELVIFLERDQLVSDKSRPVPRAPVGRGANAALWGLRIFLLIVSAMVIYTFFSQLG